MGMWVDIVACLGFVFSVTLAYLEYRRYHIKLCLMIQHAWIVWNKQNKSLVLFRLTFVNSSLSGKVVAFVPIKTQPNITCQEFVYSPDETRQKAMFPTPDGGLCPLLLAEEVIQDALDIPPQQSRSKWHGFLLQWHGQPSEGYSFSFRFYAIDTDGETLAKCEIALTLSELKTPGNHSFPKLVKIRT
jgi:hypothetical protein